MNLFIHWMRAGVFSFAASCLLANTDESKPAMQPLVPPLANAVLSPGLKAAAERDHINLSDQEVQSISPATGDAVVFWIGAAREQKNQQWLVQLKRGIATPEEQKAHRGEDVKKYLSWGSVVVFHSEVDALDLWIAGPVTTSGDARESAKTFAQPQVKRLRVFVSRDYLRLGLDDSVRANLYMSKRIQEILKVDPKFGFGHIYTLDKPIKPENVAWAKPVAERIGFTSAMEQAWTGGYVALDAFYKLAEDVPELREIAAIAMDRPAPWKYAKLAFGGHFKTFFGGANSPQIDPIKMGFLPVPLESFEVPFSFTLEDDLIVSGRIAVTSSAPPLDVSAGILALVAVHPTDKTRMVHLIAISSSRGNVIKTPKS